MVPSVAHMRAQPVRQAPLRAQAVRPRCVPPKKQEPPSCFSEERGCCGQRRSLRRAWRSCTPNLCAVALSVARAVRRRCVPPKNKSPPLVFGRNVAAATRQAGPTACAAHGTLGCLTCASSVLGHPSNAGVPKDKGCSYFQNKLGCCAKRRRSQRRTWRTGRPTGAPRRFGAPKQCADTAFLRKTRAPLLCLGGTWLLRPHACPTAPKMEHATPNLCAAALLDGQSVRKRCVPIFFCLPEELGAGGQRRCGAAHLWARHPGAPKRCADAAGLRKTRAPPLFSKRGAAAVTRR